ncbi:hypothetical protein MRX96_044938 [Rhipicephalus microplus]
MRMRLPTSLASTPGSIGTRGPVPGEALPKTESRQKCAACRKPAAQAFPEVRVRPCPRVLLACAAAGKRGFAGDQRACDECRSSRRRQHLRARGRAQQIGELRRQNQILARKIQELEAKQVGSSKPVQEAEAEDGDDGSSVTSRLTSVSRQNADTVVGPASITGSICRIESLERKTEHLEASLAALPTQIMSAVRESFQDMFTAALTQALPEMVAQVSNSVLKAVQPWVIAQIKNTTQSDSPQVKRKSASRQAAEEGFSGPAPGPDRSSAP